MLANDEFVKNCLSSTAKTLATIEENDEDNNAPKDKSKDFLKKTSSDGVVREHPITVDRSKIFTPTVKVNTPHVINIKLKNHSNTNHVLKVEGFSQYFSSNHCQV